MSPSPPPPATPTSRTQPELSPSPSYLQFNFFPSWQESGKEQVKTGTRSPNSALVFSWLLLTFVFVSVCTFCLLVCIRVFLASLRHFHLFFGGFKVAQLPRFDTKTMAVGPGASPSRKALATI